MKHITSPHSWWPILACLVCARAHGHANIEHIGASVFFDDDTHRSVCNSDGDIDDDGHLTLLMCSTKSMIRNTFTESIIWNFKLAKMYQEYIFYLFSLLLLRRSNACTIRIKDHLWRKDTHTEGRGTSCRSDQIANVYIEGHIHILLHFLRFFCSFILALHCSWKSSCCAHIFSIRYTIRKAARTGKHITVSRCVCVLAIARFLMRKYHPQKTRIVRKFICINKWGTSETCEAEKKGVLGLVLNVISKWFRRSLLEMCTRSKWSHRRLTATSAKNVRTDYFPFKGWTLAMTFNAFIGTQCDIICFHLFSFRLLLLSCLGSK